MDHIDIPAKLPALSVGLLPGEIPRRLQFLEPGADGIPACAADGGKASNSVVPILRQRQDHAQQPLGLQGQGAAEDMVLQDGIPALPFYPDGRLCHVYSSHLAEGGCWPSPPGSFISKNKYIDTSR